MSGFAQGVSVTNTVSSPADELNGVRYACLGWMLTNDAGSVSSGLTTQVVVQMTTNATLSWYWTNVYQLVTRVATNGQLQEDCSAWYTNGTPVTVTCVPDAGYHFSQWSGDCPAGSVTSNPLTVMMDQPRTVRAHVASNSAQVKIWSGTGNWFDDDSLWSPAGAPGSGDVVVVSAGAVFVTDPASMKSLVVSNAGSVQVNGEGRRVDVTVAGNVKVDGAAARLSVTNANLMVRGDLLVTNGAALVLVGGATNGVGNANGGLVEVGGIMGVATTSVIRIFSDPTNGGSFKLLVGALTLDGGGVNADAAGWAGGVSSHAEGYGPGHGHAGTYGGGAGYGGDGGAALTGSGAKGVAYGSSNAPTMPGSGGAANGAVPGGRGGGLVWVESVGNITLNGRISANGEPASPHSGAGSGGGIYFNCRQLKGNSAGRLAAEGGHVLGGGGCGGGGRIAVTCRSLSWGYTNQVSVLGGTNANHPEPEIQGQLGTIYWKILGPFGTVISIR